MGSERIPTLLRRNDRLLVAAGDDDSVGELCIDFMAKDAGDDADAIAVTTGPRAASLLERLRRSGRRFRDLAVFAIGGTDRSVATGATNGVPLGLVQSLDGSIVVPDLVERVETQVNEWEKEGNGVSMYVDSLVDRFDTGSYLDLVDGLSTVLDEANGVGVFRVPRDETGLPAIRSRFDAVVEAGPAGGKPTAGESVAPEDLFDALGSKRRWRVLRYLLGQRDERTDVEQLAREISPDGERPTEDAVRRRYVGLVHRDLPALDALGVVSFEDDRTAVEPTERIGCVEPYLALAEAESTRRS